MDKLTAARLIAAENEISHHKPVYIHMAHNWLTLLDSQVWTIKVAFCKARWLPLHGDGAQLSKQCRQWG
eukprot:SAG11_NODE_6325_length_1336_cov_1.188359_3_plen_69_part_00